GWTGAECDAAAGIDAIGARAALSRSPTTISVRQIAPSPAVFLPGSRRTTAIRIASSNRPGSATPPTEAAPPAAARASASGRCSSGESRCQPHALKAYAQRKRTPAPATMRGSAAACSPPAFAKGGIGTTAAPRAMHTKTAFTAMRIRREPARRRALPMRLDIGKSSRSLEVRSRDSTAPFGVGCRRVVSPAEASVLGLTVVVHERLQPGNEAKTPPVDLVGARVIADVVRSPRPIHEK